MIFGDTLTGDHVDAIHRRHPEIDVAVVHLGRTFFEQPRTPVWREWFSRSAGARPSRCDDRPARPVEPVGAYDAVMQIIVLLLVIWLVISLLGFLIKGLIWLAIIGLVLFVVTGALGLRSKR
jgi:hypothetical protein